MDVNELTNKILNNLQNTSEQYQLWDSLTPTDPDYMMYHPAAVGYNTTAEQIYLFQNLLLSLPPGSSVLDLGCGRGDMCNFINEFHNIPCIYTGIDQNPLMKSLAKQKYDYDIIIGNFEQEKLNNHDWVVASGVFTERRCETESEDFDKLLKNVEMMYDLANSSVAFNLLSPINTKHYDGFFYVHPGLIMDMLIEKYQYVTVRHNYSNDVYSVIINKTK